MKYICLAENCKKTFSQPAKIITTTPYNTLVPTENPNYSPNLTYAQGTTTRETYVCPYCSSIDFAEYVEPIVTEEIANVYVYDLTSGPQTELDGLLAQGYRIVSRFSKQYHLEKPKAKPAAASNENENTAASSPPVDPVEEPCRNPHELAYRGCSTICEKWKDCDALPKKTREKEPKLEPAQQTVNCKIVDEHQKTIDSLVNAKFEALEKENPAEATHNV